MQWWLLQGLLGRGMGCWLLKPVEKGVQVIHPLLVPLQFSVGVFVARDGFQAPPDPTDIILQQLFLHLLPVAAFPLPDLPPQLSLYSPHRLLIS